MFKMQPLFSIFLKKVVGVTMMLNNGEKVLTATGQQSEKLPDPKYVPKPYKAMQSPGQRVQIGVKFIPKSRLVGGGPPGRWVFPVLIHQ
jgi:hypothetical protein